MKLLFYFGHPAQYHFLKFSIRELRALGHQVIIVIKTKDVLEDLLKEDKEEYINILPEGRKHKRLSILLSLLKRDIRLFGFAFKKRFDLFIGTDPSLSHVGWLLRVPCITVLEDDHEVIPDLARLTYPFTTHILVPEVVRVGKYERKKIGYAGYMKLAYLHPNWFRENPVHTQKPYIILRLSKLEAHHDFGVRGISESFLEKLVDQCIKYGDVYISCERPVSEKYKSFVNVIKPSRIHNLLAGSSLIISDSQSMTVEAAMLGIPSVRISDLVGRLSVLEELEHKYGLTFGFRPDDCEGVFKKVRELTNDANISQSFQRRRDRMLNDKIDVTAFLIWFFDNYPKSVEKMREYPDYQFRFK